MSRNARSDRVRARKMAITLVPSGTVSPRLKCRRRHDASSDVPPGTVALITACSCANMQEVIMAHTTACNINVALSALLLDRRRLYLSSVTSRKGRSQWRPDRSANAGAGVAGSLEGTADGTVRSAREWSAPAAVGWVTKLIDATCATGGGGVQNPTGASARGGSGVRSATPATCTSNALHAARRYVDRAALAAKDAVSMNATNAVLPMTSGAVRRRPPEATRPKGTASTLEFRARMERPALERSVGRRLTMNVLTLSRRSGMVAVSASRLASAWRPR